MAKKKIRFLVWLSIGVLLFLRVVSSQIEVRLTPLPGTDEFMVTHNGPVRTGSPLVFVGSCSGQEKALVVCSDNQVCTKDSPATRCVSEFTNESEKRCVYTTSDADAGTHDDDVATCCTKDGLCETSTVHVERWAAIRPSTTTQAEDFTLFPKNLRIRKEGDDIRVMNTTIIVGAQAPSEDALSAAELVNALVKPLNKRIFSVLDTATTPEMLEKDNLIIIGNSTINTLMAEWKAEEESLPSNIAKVKWIEKRQQQIIVIMGMDSAQRRKAAALLKEYEKRRLEGAEICVTGDVENRKDIQQVSCTTLEIMPTQERERQVEGSGQPATIGIPFTEVECVSGEKERVECKSSLASSDKKHVELATSKGRNAQIAATFNAEKVPSRTILTIEQQMGSAAQQRTVVYVLDGTLKYACTLAAETSETEKEANCDLTPLIKNETISVVIEGMTDLRLQYWRINALALHVAYEGERKSVKNNGPVEPGSKLTFTGYCEKESSWLMVCRDNLPCSAKTPQESVLCLSPVTSNTEKSCVYTPERSERGVHELSIATCCTLNEECDTTTTGVEPWIVSDKRIEEEGAVLLQPTQGKETLVQGQAEVEHPVQWIKRIQVDEPTTNLTIIIPPESSRVKIKKISKETGEEISPDSIRLIEHPVEKVVMIDEEVEEVEVEYYTEEPKVSESEVDKSKKVITIQSATHYTNISAFTMVKETRQESIRLYRTTEGIREPVRIDEYIDNNSNGLIDGIRWTVPSLSNQTYEVIIEIIKALHLDESYVFISDVYNQTKERDDVWSETIPNGHIVRVTFEKNLTAANDITVLPRKVKGKPSIEVYEAGSTEILAKIVAPPDNEYSTVLLSSMGGSQDTFDLRIVNGDLQFDHIIDPSAARFFENCVDVTDWTITSIWNVVGNQCQAKNTGGIEHNMTSGTIDLSGDTEANLSFSYTTAGLDAGEYFKVYASNGAGYVELVTITANEASSKVIPLHTFFTLTSTVTIRGACKNNANSETCTWDNINVTGFQPDRAPWYTDILKNETTVTSNKFVNFSANWSDDVGLDSFIFSINQSTEFVNSSSIAFSGTAAESSNVSQITAPAGTNVSWMFYATDTVGNTNKTDIQTFVVEEGQANVAPSVVNISAVPDQSITESGAAQLSVSFIATDGNTAGDLNRSSAAMNVSTVGSDRRYNNSCAYIGDIGADASNFTCTIDLWYFDAPGNWTIYASIKDNSSVYAENTSNFTLLPTLAIVVGPTSISFPAINPGSENVTALQAIAVNNTGNQNVTINNTRVQGFDLVGQTDNTKIIPAGNFTIDVNSGAGNPQCGVQTVMVNNTIAAIINSIIPRGNNTLGNNPEHGKEQLFPCLRKAPLGDVLTAQTYSASGGSAWIISAV